LYYTLAKLVARPDDYGCSQVSNHPALHQAQLRKVADSVPWCPHH